MSDGAIISNLTRVAIVGSHPVVERAKGTWCSVDYNADIGSVDMGLDGTGTFRLTPDLSAIVTLTIQAQSQSSDYLSAWVAQLLNGALVLKPLRLKDVTGTTIASASRCMPVRIPSIQWTDGVETRAWALVTTKLTTHLGGLLPAVVTP